MLRPGWTAETPPPSGRRRSWVHYGVMVPGLPGPHRYFGVMAVVGTPGASFVANDDRITTTPRDTAYLVSSRFHTYSIHRDCDFAPDGSRLRFGTDLTITGRQDRSPTWQVHRTDPAAALTLEATRAVTSFVRLPGIYSHWSVLCRVTGTVGATTVDTLGTFEYARGVGVHSLADRPLPRALRLPVPLFVYSVLNVDEHTQLLFCHVRGPGGVPLQRAVHVRTLDGTTDTRRTGHRFGVRATTAHRTPDGRTMQLPLEFDWAVDGIAVHGRANDDFSYGLGAGYVGTYDYDAEVDGRRVSGRAYLEYVDLR